jgi:fumarate reductase subunit D
MKRSNAPIFWLLFGAGGMLAALFGSVVVWLSGFDGPFALTVSPEFFSYTNILAIAQNPIGKAFLFAIAVLFAWHAAHRMFHSLHDIGIHGGVIAKLLCYGTAFVITLICAYSLLILGF